MAHTTDAPRSRNQFERRQRGADPEVVGDLSVLDRDVEVGADEHPLAAHIPEVVEGRDAADHLLFLRRPTFEPQYSVVSIRRLL